VALLEEVVALSLTMPDQQCCNCVLLTCKTSSCGATIIAGVGLCSQFKCLIFYLGKDSHDPQFNASLLTSSKVQALWNGAASTAFCCFRTRNKGTVNIRWWTTFHTGNKVFL
jgi:hypothetical protein